MISIMLGIAASIGILSGFIFMAILPFISILPISEKKLQLASITVGCSVFLITSLTKSLEVDLLEYIFPALIATITFYLAYKKSFGIIE